MEDASRYYTRAVELDPEDMRAVGRLRGILVGMEEVLPDEPPLDEEPPYVDPLDPWN